MSGKRIEVVTFTLRQISQKRAENALAMCLPDELRDAWLREFRSQNQDLRDSGETPLSAAEFIKCRLEDFVGANRSPF